MKANEDVHVSACVSANDRSVAEKIGLAMLTLLVAVLVVSACVTVVIEIEMGTVMAKPIDAIGESVPYAENTPRAMGCRIAVWCRLCSGASRVWEVVSTTMKEKVKESVDEVDGVCGAENMIGTSIVTGTKTKSRNTTAIQDVSFLYGIAQAQEMTQTKRKILKNSPGDCAWTI